MNFYFDGRQIWTGLPPSWKVAGHHRDTGPEAEARFFHRWL